MIASHKALVVVALLFAAVFGLPGVSAVREAAAQIAVTAADPSAADQGTISLPVTIKGNGFKKGAKAKFYVAGTSDPGGITVSSTRFISSTQLTATIDVAATAVVAGFDIVVTNADGRTGKGTELFKVTETVDPCTVPDPVPLPSSSISYSPGLPGYLDGNFGGGTGRVVGPRHMGVTPYSGASGIATDGLGRIVAVGDWHNPCVHNSSYEWAIARYLADGRMDLSFGANGTGLVRIPFAGGQPYATEVVVQPDGKIVIAGSAVPSRRSSNVAVVVRLTDSGALDTTFSGDGIAWVSPGTTYTWGSDFLSITAQSDGKLIAAGKAYYPAHAPYGVDGFICRLNQDGTLDAGFNAGKGLRLVPQAGFYEARTQWVGVEERVIVAGYTRDGVGHRIGGVWRFTASGALDGAFGTSGVVATTFHDVEDGLYYEEEFKDLAIDSENRVVAVGFASANTLVTDPPSAQLALARYDVSGNLNPTFGNAGRVLAPFGQTSGWGIGVAIPGDGRILVGGSSWNYSGGESADNMAGVWRFTPDGAPDPTFGVNGRALDPILHNTRGVFGGRLLMQPDGTFIWAGSAVVWGDTLLRYFILARFWQ